MSVIFFGKKDEDQVSIFHTFAINNKNGFFPSGFQIYDISYEDYVTISESPLWNDIS